MEPMNETKTNEILKQTEKETLNQNARNRSKKRSTNKDDYFEIGQNGGNYKKGKCGWYFGG